MDQLETAEIARKSSRRASGSMQESTGEGRPRPQPPQGGRGWFAQYKPEQGKATRVGTFIGAGLMVVWGAMFIKGYVDVYAEEGSQWWRQLISPGIPILFALVVGAIAWRITFAHRKVGDFMIATEGEMKKVNWSSKAEIIGSTKVVIFFTFLLAGLLFVVDVAFQRLFQWLGVLGG